MGHLASLALAPPKKLHVATERAVKTKMMTRLREKLHGQNLYVWAAALGGIGVLDIVLPGPRIDHVLGLAIAIVAVYVWVVQ